MPTGPKFSEHKPIAVREKWDSETVEVGFFRSHEGRVEMQISVRRFYDSGRMIETYALNHLDEEEATLLQEWLADTADDHK